MLVCLFSSDDSNLDLLSHATDLDNSSEPIRVIIRNLSGQILDENEIPGDGLLSALPNMPTLERVKLLDMIGDVADSFILAAVQNEAIHTVEMEAVDCSAHVFRAVLKQKRRVHIYSCGFIESNTHHDSSTPIATAALVERSDSYNACQVQEFEIRCKRGDFVTMIQALESIPENMSFPALCKLSVVQCGVPFETEDLDNIASQLDDNNDLDESWIRLTSILKVAPLLEELHIKGFAFADPSIFNTFATNINDAPCPRLHWSLSDCNMTGETLDVLGDVVCRENAKLLRFCVGPADNGHYDDLLVQILLNYHSCVRELVYWCRSYDDYPGRDRGLEYILEALQGRIGMCQLTTIELYLDPRHLSLYFDLIKSIPRWTPRVKNLRIGCHTAQQKRRWFYEQKLPHPREQGHFFPNKKVH